MLSTTACWRNRGWNSDDTGVFAVRGDNRPRIALAVVTRCGVNPAPEADFRNW